MLKLKNIKKNYESGEEIDVSRNPKTLVKLPVEQFLEKNAMMRLKVFDKSDFL